MEWGYLVVVRETLCAVGLAALLASAIAVTHSLAAVGPTAAASSDLTVGRTLYRKFCGQCHALAQAHAAGFGSNTKGGFGDLGGPSFNELRVPYVFSVTAVTEPTGGHELVRKKITSKQLHTVATYIARTTRHNPIPALPTDG